MPKKTTTNEQMDNEPMGQHVKTWQGGKCKSLFKRTFCTWNMFMSMFYVFLISLYNEVLRWFNDAWLEKSFVTPVGEHEKRPILCFHSILHQEVLKRVASNLVDVNNFIVTRALSDGQFKALKKLGVIILACFFSEICLFPSTGRVCIWTKAASLNQEHWNWTSSGLQDFGTARILNCMYSDWPPLKNSISSS